MLISVKLATTKIAASETSTAAPADRERHARGDHRAEHEQQGQAGQGQRDELAPSQVVLGDGLDVAVERRPAGQLDRDRPAGQAGQPLLDAGQGVGRIVGADIEEDDVVGGLPIGRDLARSQLVREDLGDVRRASRSPIARRAVADSKAGWPARADVLE